MVTNLTRTTILAVVQFLPWPIYNLLAIFSTINWNSTFTRWDTKSGRLKKLHPTPLPVWLPTWGTIDAWIQGTKKESSSRERCSKESWLCSFLLTSSIPSQSSRNLLLIVTTPHVKNIAVSPQLVLFYKLIIFYLSRKLSLFCLGCLPNSLSTMDSTSYLITPILSHMYYKLDHKVSFVYHTTGSQSLS
jgi:hypothetical protein